ncbi:hypothetical protein RDI58_014995 [Solanum bulbocastanum]|uniref:Uncharacterized protein n=1 Tax=Solanum bulbocastanum TaxID=147425 RepID=A0AAN8TEP6_SOLBU
MDKFPSEAQSESPVPLVLASPTPVEAQRVAVPLALPVTLVLEEAKDTTPLVPIVPPPETVEPTFHRYLPRPAGSVSPQMQGRGFIVIVSQDHVKAQVSLRVVDMIVPF